MLTLPTSAKWKANNKPVSKIYLSNSALLYDMDEKELLMLWLADRVYGVV
jgi:hypothetical protein